MQIAIEKAKFEGGYVENTNTKFDSISSISISFVVKKNQSGVLHVFPTGLLFYMVAPDYEKTVQYMACYFHVSTDYLLMGKDCGMEEHRTRIMDG